MAKKGLETIDDGVKGLGESVADVNKSVNKLAQGLEQLSNAGFKTSAGFDNLANGLKNIAGSTGEFSKSIDAITSKIPGLGTVASAALAPLTLVSKTIEESIGAMHGAVTAAMQVMDASSKPFREASKDLWALERAFAGSFETADKFTTLLLETSGSEFARSTYMSSEALMEMAQATQGTSIRLEELGGTIETGMGSLNLWSVATAHAASMGMKATVYMDQLNTAMNKQGMTAQEAVEQMAMFGSIASETGLNISKVSEGLNTAAQGFAKIGMSADFGKPFLEGFASSLTSMGFGVENAIGLTQTLSDKLGKLTENYGLAYITFQRGGLDIGGGGSTGVLGASIGLQAAMMEAEQTGDQSNIAAQLAGGLRDTLASFTGGSIVTVGEAAENPAMQSAFYTQQQLLTKQYGMDQQSATRTLEMLAGLDEATQSGDTDLQAELQGQISEQMSADNKTLDLQEKMNRGIGSLVALFMANNRMMYEQTRLLGDDTVGGMINTAGGGLAGLNTWLQGAAADVEANSGGMGSMAGREAMAGHTSTYAGPLSTTRARANINKMISDFKATGGSLDDGSATAADLTTREKYVKSIEQRAIATRRATQEAEITAGYEEESESRRQKARDHQQALSEGTEFTSEQLGAAERDFGGAWDATGWERRERDRISGARGEALPGASGETSMSLIGKSLQRILQREDPVRRVEITAGDNLLTLVDSMRETQGESTT